MRDHPTEAGFITTVDQDLKLLEERVDQPVPRRPLWKRIAPFPARVLGAFLANGSGPYE